VDAWSSASVGRATVRGPVTPNCSEPGVAIVITRQAATSEAGNAERRKERRRMNDEKVDGAFEDRR
jgi:hypothetical protein